MIASGSGPRFETCPSVPGMFGWNQCELPASELVTFIGVGTGVGLVALLFGYVFYKWTKRRHGSVIVYGRRKRYDFKALLRQMNLLPPETANYFQISILAGVAFGLRIAIAITGEISSYEPLCDFQQEFFVDKSSQIEMYLDNCQVNFLPVPEQPSPDNQLLAVKVKLAIAKDPQIVVETSTCNLKATFDVSNNKPESVRYLQYWCGTVDLQPCSVMSVAFQYCVLER